MEQNRINTVEELTKTIESRVLASASRAVTIEANYFRRMAPGIDPNLRDESESCGFTEDIPVYEVLNQLMRDGYTVTEPYYRIISDYYHVSLGGNISFFEANNNFRRKYGVLLLTA